MRNRLERARKRLREALLSRGSMRVSPGLQARLQSLLQKWAARSFDDGFKPIQDFEIECARERDLIEAEDSGDADRVIAVLEKRYRGQVIEQYGSVELRGVQISHRVILDLDEVYVPLHLQEPELAGESVTLKAGENRIPALAILQQHQTMLLVGAPGSGKSTLVSYIATGLADGRLSSQVQWPDQPLPFVLLVRTLSDALFTPEWFARCLGIDIRLATQTIQQERVVLLIDGVDEASPQIRGELLSALLKFLSENPRVRALVTSRPSGGIGEIENCFPTFRHFRLSDFTLSDVQIFIDKWCLAAEKSVRKDVVEARKQARAASADLKSRISLSRPVQRIAVNPLLTTILCVVHRFLGRSIPEHRVTLYEKCTDALLYEWDRAKFPTGAAVGSLDAPQKRALLRGVARSLHEKHMAEVAEQEVIQHFAKMLPALGKPESDAQRIVQEIRDRSGLLVERRPGHFGFSHLTFQEYLTALDCVSSRSWTQLIASSNDPWWQEVIALAAGAPGTDSGVIIQALLDNNNRQSTLLAAQCAETALDLPVAIRQRVECALDKLLPPKSFEEAEQIKSVGMAAAPLLMKHLLLPQSADSRAWNLIALEYIDYEPAVPVIAQCVDDESGSNIFFDRPRTSDKKNRVKLGYELSVGDYAKYILLVKAQNSEPARRAFIAALSQRPVRLPILEWFRNRVLKEDYDKERARELMPAIDAALKAAVGRGRAWSKRSKSTGKAQPNKRARDPLES